jgi:uncharacterized repeat protein (TIGR01451 family)
METKLYTPKHLACVAILMLLSRFMLATGEPSTYFNIFVPPNNDNVQRNVCLVVTAIYDSTYFSIVDDGMDGDTDDSKTGMLNAGQSYILYIKDNGINDDAKYASGGTLKQDGDYFIITSDKLMYASQSTNSDWQHDWVPATNKTGIGEKFIIYAPQITSSNRDLNVFAYQDSTQITVRKISTSANLTTGYTNVDMNSTDIVVQKSLNVGQDLIYANSEGRNLMTSGHTYVVESDKPITLQYGSLIVNERDGGGYVPSSTGNSSGNLFYFGVPYQSGTNGEQEIRIVSSSNTNSITLERYSAGTWLAVKSWTANANTAVDWVGRNNGNVNYPTVFRITCSTGKKVTVFEANWLETGNPGTSDIGTMCSSLDGNSSGEDFIVYLAPPGNEQNVRNPFGDTLFKQQLTHAYLFAFNDTCHVTVKDLFSNGVDLNRTYTIMPGKYVDCFLTLTQWKSIYNGTGTIAGGAERPYISIHSDNPISVMNTNFNDNWMMYFGSSLMQSFSQTSSTSKETAVSGDTISITSKLVFTNQSNIDSVAVKVVVGSGLRVISSQLSDNTSGTVVDGNVASNNNQSIITFPTQDTLVSTHDYNITTSVVPQVMYNNGNLVTANTVVGVETIITGKIDGITQQSSASSGLKIQSNNTSNLIFSLATFNADLTNSWSASIVDADNDGWEDIFVTDKDLNKPNLFYKNAGGNVFTKLTPNKLCTDLASSVCSSWADFSNDGKRDIFVVNNTRKFNSLLINNGNLNFQSAPTGNLTNHAGYFHSGSFADYDNDGWLDIFVSNFMPTRFNELYHNNGNGTFTQQFNNPIAMESFRSLGATWADYDNDGDQDLFVPNGDNNKNSFFINNGNAKFTKASNLNICNDLGNSVGSCWGDVNNDGWLDLFVANASNQNNFLYINNKLGGFTKIVTGEVVTNGGHSHGCSFADIDNDMDLDLYVTNDIGIKFLYMNDGTGNFTRKTDEVVEANYGKSMGHSWFDADKDGDLDLFVATHSGQKNYFFTNNGNANSWVNIKLVGNISNKDAIGARVSVKAGGVWQCREVNAQSGIGGQSSVRCHFGLGVNTIIDSIVIKWPSGLKHYIANESINSFKTINEPSGATLNGIVYFDKNNNCVKDANENYVGNIKIEVDGNQNYISNTAGQFSASVISGTHTINVSSQGYWISTCTSQIISVNSVTDVLTVNVPVTSTVIGSDISVNLAATAMRRGFKNQVELVAENIGTETSYRVTLQLNLLAGMSITKASPAYSSKTNSTYTWMIDSILPGQTAAISVLDSVHLSKKIGESLTLVLSANGDNDVDLTNNSITKTYEVVGAIDPNDLLVSPIGEGTEGFVKRDTKLTYTIRFQNVGNYAAENVYIENQIPEGLDLEKISQVISSHHFNYKLSNEGLLSVWFNGINLPDSASNQSLSNGFISFTLPINKNCIAGYKLISQASIKFDFEDAILTNKVINTITHQNASEVLLAYPIPAQEVLNLKLLSAGEKYQSGNKLASVSLYNFQGSLIRECNSYEGINSINVSSYSSGIYFVIAKDMFGNSYSKKIIIKK